MRAVERGFDGVEPGNVTAHNNDTGLDISSADQLSFNTFLADSAHGRGLLVGLKNNLDQVPDLVDRFDFAVNPVCVAFVPPGCLRRCVTAAFEYL